MQNTHQQIPTRPQFLTQFLANLLAITNFMFYRHTVAQHGDASSLNTNHTILESTPPVQHSPQDKLTKELL